MTNAMMKSAWMPMIATFARATETCEREHGGLRFRRMRRTSVKGYSRLQSWVLRRASGKSGT